MICCCKSSPVAFYSDKLEKKHPSWSSFSTWAARNCFEDVLCACRCGVVFWIEFSPTAFESLWQLAFLKQSNPSLKLLGRAADVRVLLDVTSMLCNWKVGLQTALSRGETWERWCCGCAMLSEVSLCGIMLTVTVERCSKGDEDTLWKARTHHIPAEVICFPFLRGADLRSVFAIPWGPFREPHRATVSQARLLWTERSGGLADADAMRCGRWHHSIVLVAVRCCYAIYLYFSISL